LTELEKLNETLSNNDPDTMTLENNPINTSRWTDKTKLAYLCFVGKVNGAGVSVNLASAFRTDAYQRHLWEIYNRWKTLGLSTNTDETCTVLKKKVHDEWSEHGLQGLRTSPAFKAGKHPKGTAFDISRKTTIRQLEAMRVDITKFVEPCDLNYPLPVLDKGHFESK
jgi:hypothetical protein